jgi:hypothetical protein
LQPEGELLQLPLGKPKPKPTTRTPPPTSSSLERPESRKRDRGEGTEEKNVKNVFKFPVEWIVKIDGVQACTHNSWHFEFTSSIASVSPSAVMRKTS